MLIHRLDAGDVKGPRVSAAVHTNIMWSYHGDVSLYWFAMSLLLRTLAQAECCFTVEWLGKPEDRKAILKNPGVGFLLLGGSMYVQGVWLCWIQLNMGTRCLQMGKCCHTSSLCGCDFRFWEKLPLSERLVYSFRPWSLCLALYDGFVVWNWCSKTYRFGFGSQWILLSETAALILRLWSLFTVLVPHYLLGAFKKIYMLYQMTAVWLDNKINSFLKKEKGASLPLIQQRRRSCNLGNTVSFAGSDLSVITISQHNWEYFTVWYW